MAERLARLSRRLARRGVGLAFLLALAVGFLACDSTSVMRPPEAPSSSPAPPPANTHRVSDTATAATANPANGGTFGFYAFDLDSPRSGRATLILTWANADVSLALYLTTRACPNVTALQTGACTILGQSGFGNPPVGFTTAASAGDSGKVWVINWETSPEPFTLDITIP